MKDNDGKKETKYLTAAIFMLLIFVMFGLNISETVSNAIHGENNGLRADAHDLEAIDCAVYPFINVNGLYQRIMQRGYVYDIDPENDTIKTRHDQLVSVSSAASKDKIEEAAARLGGTSEWLADRGIPLIYVQAPSKLSFSPEEPMPGIANNTYEKTETFLSAIEKENVEYIDTRDWLADQAEKSFYDTDHHWTTETCLDVAIRLGEYLNENHGFNIDGSVLDSANYDTVTYDDAFLGAEGRRTGRYYIGLDDFSVIKPAFDTSFHLEIDSKETGHSVREGTFDETVMDKEKDVQHYSFEDSAYYTYWGGDYGRVEVTNNKVTDGSRVLVFKDSYGIPVTAFMSNMFSSMDIIDIRYYEGDKTIKEIIEETGPDAVIYIYGSGYLSKKKMFSLK